MIIENVNENEVQVVGTKRRLVEEVEEEEVGTPSKKRKLSSSDAIDVELDSGSDVEILEGAVEVIDID